MPWFFLRSEYFYPRPPRGGRPEHRHCTRCLTHISIHALREEGDLFGSSSSSIFSISIHALREEGDVSFSPNMFLKCYFYPRPPRGGRRCGLSRFRKCDGISIHALREEGDRLLHVLSAFTTISIHALREEGDGLLVLSPYSAARFLSTPSARRATRYRVPFLASASNFYPRPPRGGRQGMNAKRLANELFLSTPSARRATLSTYPVLA